MAFTTVNGSDGAVSLVGTTGIDQATLVTLNSNVFVGGNTGNDQITIAPGTGNLNATDWNVRMGGGDDGINLNSNLLNSFVSLDGETLANDGNDVFNDAGFSIIDSELRAMGGNDQLQLASVSGSVINGNAGNDVFTSTGAGPGPDAFSTSTILGGQGIDTMTFTVLGAGNEINGNRGSDTISVTTTTLATTTLFGGQGGDNITLIGATIDGNTLSGDLGDDILAGSAASADILLGGDGNDALNGGGGGLDTLTGGAGIDAFAVTAGISNSAEAIITDYVGSGAGAETITITSTNGAAAAVITAVGTTTTAGANLRASLAANGGVTGAAAFGGNNTIALTYTAGAAGAAFAGTYILSDINGTNTFDAGDSITQVNSLTGLATQLTYV